MTLKNQVHSESSSSNTRRVAQSVTHNSTSRDNTDLECVVSNTLQRLIKFYRNNISIEERRQLTVAPLKGRLDKKTATVITEIQEGMLNLLELPTSLQLLVFSYLDVRSLCQISRTCQQFRNVSSDHLLWGKILKRDLQKRNVINYQTHPQIYLDAGSDLTLKEIYARCCSNFHQNVDLAVANSSLAVRFLKFARPFFYPIPPSRLVMFGPGLESQTSSVVHQLLWSEVSPFQVEGMFPGQHDGVGSGVSLNYDDKHINLMILYSSTKKEREDAARDGLKTKNKFLLENAKEPVENERPMVAEVTHPVRQLCKTINGFIFVVDSSVTKEKVSETKDILRAMMDERWTDQKAPLLVLSCAFSTSQTFLSCADIAEALEVFDLNRHWQINRLLVDNLEGIRGGTDWLLRNC